MKLSEYLQQQDKRVNALESESMDDLVTIARIKKLYSDIKVTQVLRATVASYQTCSSTLVCSSILKNTSAFNQFTFY